MFPWLKRGLFFVGDLVQLCHRQCLEWKLAEAAPWHADSLDEEMEAAIQRVRVGPAVLEVFGRGEAHALRRRNCADHDLHHHHQEQLPFQ